MSRHRPRASVTSQVIPQPLILAATAAATTTTTSTTHRDSMSRQNSQHSSKRDSVVGIAGLVHRVPSFKNPRPTSDPTAMTNAANWPSTPTYKLVRPRLFLTSNPFAIKVQRKTWMIAARVAALSHWAGRWCHGWNSNRQ